MAEEWKYIEGFEDYQVSNLGRVKSLKLGRNNILKARKNGSGYLQVLLYGKKKINSAVHRLVLVHFKPIDNFQNLEVNHINGIKDDNKLENLEWVTHSENLKHALKIGLIPKGVDSYNYGKTFSYETRDKISTSRKYLFEINELNLQGVNAPNHKLSEEDIKQIRILLKENKMTQREIAKMYNVHFNTISMIKLGKTWSHIHNE